MDVYANDHNYAEPCHILATLSFSYQMFSGFGIIITVIRNFAFNERDDISFWQFYEGNLGLLFSQNG